MEFEWDEAKNHANVVKHGFDFTFAVRIFDGQVRRFVDPRPWGERIVATSRGPVYHPGLHSPRATLPDHFGPSGTLG
jgi:hypothetical protein